MWTTLLVVSVLTGVWLSGRHWWGWLISAASEALWLIHGLMRDDTAVIVMAVMLLVINLRNAIVTRPKSGRRRFDKWKAQHGTR